MTAKNKERKGRCARLAREIAGSKDPMRTKQLREKLFGVQRECPHTGVETILSALTETCPICLSPRDPLLPKR